MNNHKEENNLRFALRNHMIFEQYRLSKLVKKRFPSNYFLSEMLKNSYVL